MAKKLYEREREKENSGRNEEKGSEWWSEDIRRVGERKQEDFLIWGRGEQGVGKSIGERKGWLKGWQESRGRE